MTNPISDHLAINLDRALKANPNLMHHPDLAYAVANAGGNIEDNALEIYGVYMKHLAMTTTLEALSRLNSEHDTHEMMSKDPQSAKYLLGDHGG